jgi:hypothetical protein
MRKKLIETPVLSEMVKAVIGEPLENYIREKHNQDRCMGFIDGYEAATKTFSEEDLKEAFNAGTHWKEKWKTVTDDNINIPDVNKFIESLKQTKI